MLTFFRRFLFRAIVSPFSQTLNFLLTQVISRQSQEKCGISSRSSSVALVQGASQPAFLICLMNCLLLDIR